MRESDFSNSINYRAYVSLGLEYEEMGRLVQKFGGSSVADLNLIRNAAEIAVKTASEGHEVLTVVSAMGKTTDNLISLAEQIAANPNARELDMLLSTGEQVSVALMSMAIQELGWQARSFTGAQAGIRTECQHGLAKIKEIQSEKLEASLARGEIAVVAGFQGIADNEEITTLGRGGSDTTAVALAAQLGAERCDIFTDVNGVYTADPRLLPEAKRLSAISYEEMLELAATGAKVMNARSVELAMDTHMPIRVRSTFQPDDLGTLVTHRFVAPEYTIAGISLDLSQAAVSLKTPHLALHETKPLDGVTSLFTRLQELNIQTDMVMLLAREDEPLQELAFTLDEKVLPRVKALISSLDESLGNPDVTADTDIARISVVGRRLTARPEVVAGVFEALNSAQIPVHMVATADIRVSVLLPVRYASFAVKLIHDRFGLSNGSFRALD